MALISLKLSYETEKKFGNITFITFNDGIHNTLITGIFKFNYDVQNIFVKFQWRVPESHGDEKYEKIFFRTNTNLKRVLEGVRGNSIIALVADVILKSVDEKDRYLPYKKVT